MTLPDSTNEFKLEEAPEDLISAVNFGPSSSQFLLASSWDCTVRLFDVTNNTKRLQYNHDAPVLDCCFQDQLYAWSGDLGGQLLTFDFNGYEHQGKKVGSHDAAIKCVEYCPDIHAVITGSWDQTVKLWDIRAPETPSTYRVPDKVYTMAICGEKLIVGTAGRRILVYDLRAMNYVEQLRESSLKYQTRCIRAFPNKQGYVVSSIEAYILFLLLHKFSGVIGKLCQRLWSKWEAQQHQPYLFIIQEPHAKNGKIASIPKCWKSWLSKSGKAGIITLPTCSSPVVLSAKENTMATKITINSKAFTIISSYSSPNANFREILGELTDLTTNINGEECLIGVDFNAHSQHWGYRNEDSRKSTSGVYCRKASSFSTAAIPLRLLSTTIDKAGPT
ncbi:Mitotic checkpoint protein BUB3 [Araneus ventricosus]|uniref:Mitotic checkpoint protein BUB3 n=1 Tax=Araneus ventricosus TaxID=182803 RepID=A0A4Y2R9Y6_ARAVE|nr:Mitotic checkpoint protein BUB3 [Araneus ventricosus]